MKFHCLLFCVVCSIILSCASLKKGDGVNTLPATALQAYGRYALSQGQHLELISSGVHFGFSFEGRECQLVAAVPNEKGHNYLQYELDGIYQKRIKVNGSASQMIPIKAQAKGKHKVTIYKATEAHTGDILINKIEVIGTHTKRRAINAARLFALH